MEKRLVGLGMDEMRRRPVLLLQVLELLLLMTRGGSMDSNAVRVLANTVCRPMASTTTDGTAAGSDNDSVILIMPMASFTCDWYLGATSRPALANDALVRSQT
jgi:hypothetical protein